jgi:hypothetical protein
MKQLHDPAVRSELEARLAALRPDAQRKWGSMTPDQMLWHVNQFLGWSMGENCPPAKKSNAVAAALMKFFLIYVPWPKGAPTNPNAKVAAATRHDFEAERAKCRALIDRFVSKPVDGAWPDDPSFGPADGTFASRLQAKHLNHHFTQFGV